VVPLQNAVDSECPITYGIVQAGHHIPDGVPYIRVSDMARPQLTLEGMLRTAPGNRRSLPPFRGSYGRYCFRDSPTVGKMRFVSEELNGANLTQGTARIAPGTNTTTPWFVVEAFLRFRLFAFMVKAAIQVSTPPQAIAVLHGKGEQVL